MHKSDTTGTPGTITELSMADSFIMGVLCGWRLLQAASLSPEDKRDILSTTRNSLEYEAISQALQMLWDEQLLGNRQRPPQHLNYHEADLNYQDAWDQDWEPWDPSDEGWFDNAWTQSGWEEDPESRSSPAVPELPDEALSAEEQDKLRGAMQAERAAEQMAMDAQRTWTEAQRATQLVRKDRGFGASFSNSGKGNSSRSPTSFQG